MPRRTRNCFRAFRAYAGGVSLVLGGAGLVMFSLLAAFALAAHYWMLSHGANIASSQLDDVVATRLGPLLALAIVLILYGFYEAHCELKNEY